MIDGISSKLERTSCVSGKRILVWRPLNKFTLCACLALRVDARIKSGRDQLYSSLPGPDPAIHPWPPRGGRPARRDGKASGGSYLRDITLDTAMVTGR